MPQVTKLSKCLQTEKLQLSVISSLVDVTLQTLLFLATNWILELQDINLFRILMAGIHDANLYQGEMLLHLVLTVYPSSGIAVYACFSVVKKYRASNLAFKFQ